MTEEVGGEGSGVHMQLYHLYSSLCTPNVIKSNNDVEIDDKEKAIPDTLIGLDNLKERNLIHRQESINKISIRK
jgi:hypothetical protein